MDTVNSGSSRDSEDGSIVGDRLASMGEDDADSIIGDTTNCAFDYIPSIWTTRDLDWNWVATNELRARRLGFASTRSRTCRPSIQTFSRHASGSMYSIRKLKQTRALRGHGDRINCLDFGEESGLLCSGGNDKSVCIWKWQQHTPVDLKIRIRPGHEGGIFPAKFCLSDTCIISAARDGSVCLSDIETAKWHQIMTSPHEVSGITRIDQNSLLTCGLDAHVNLVDLRTRAYDTLFKDRPLCLIDSHPLDKNIIAVSGYSTYVALFDIRHYGRELYKASIEKSRKRCFGSMKDLLHFVSSIAFSPNGDKLLVSYNYDDLYVFNSTNCSVHGQYKGHYVCDAYTTCAWFGNKYIMCGSDCGHIFGWCLETGKIVCLLKTNTGIASTVRVHPNLPVIASCGFDGDIELWEPKAEICDLDVEQAIALASKNFRGVLLATAKWRGDEDNYYIDHTDSD